jgi:hypothetical protein
MPGQALRANCGNPLFWLAAGQRFLPHGFGWANSQLITKGENWVERVGA